MQWFVSTALLSIVSYTMHSSVRPTAYFMLRRVKLWCKLPIWPVLLKLWMSLYFFFFVGTFFSTLCAEKPESRDCLFAHELMWYICLYRSNGPGPAPCPLCKWKKLFSLCQYKGRNQCIEGGDMTQMEAVWNRTTVGWWLMLMWPLDKRSIPHAARANISTLDKIICGIYKIRCILTK